MLMCVCGACRVRIQIHKHHQCVDAFLSIALACTGTKWPHKFFCELFSTHRVPHQCPVDSESHIEPHRCCTPSWGQGSSQKTRPEAWRIQIAIAEVVAVVVTKCRWSCLLTCLQQIGVQCFPLLLLRNPQPQKQGLVVLQELKNWAYEKPCDALQPAEIYHTNTY